VPKMGQSLDQMGQPQFAHSTDTLSARSLDSEPITASGAGLAADHNRGGQGKPVGAVVAAANVLRTLHASERPLNASEVARAAGLHRGTAYNILRTLQAEGFVGYDEATRTYAVSLHILELAYGALRRSGLLDIARPLVHAVADAHRVSVYLSKVLGPSSLLLLDWVGGVRSDPHIAVGRPHPSPAGASGVVIGAFGNNSEPELEALLSQVEWYRKPSFPEFLTWVKEAKEAGLVDVLTDQDGLRPLITKDLGNEIDILNDFGRPARVTLAVLVDRGGRELPIAAAVSAARITLPHGQRLSLARDDAGRFTFEIEERG